MKRILLFYCLLLVQAVACAQYNIKENNVWIFGQRAGLDFNSGTAVPVKSKMGQKFLSSASVCDTSGQLLFYANRDTVYTKNGRVMPNGVSISPAGGIDGDNIQSVLIAPVLENPDQYYIFSFDEWLNAVWRGDLATCRLYYTVVDMSIPWMWRDTNYHTETRTVVDPVTQDITYILDTVSISVDSSLEYGDVLPQAKGIQLDSGLAQKLVVVPGDNCNMWLIAHNYSGTNFRTFEIKAALPGSKPGSGVNPVPVVSSIGLLGEQMFSYLFGEMKLSPNRRKIAVTSAVALPPPMESVGIELYDFDPATGVVSNPMIVDSIPAYGVCFSPDNSKLYATSGFAGLWGFGLHQYDISLPTPADIIASKTLLDTGIVSDTVIEQFTNPRLGPDGKVYVALLDGHDDSAYTTRYINRVEFPDKAGAACNYVRKAVRTLDSTKVGLALPSDYWKPLQDTVYSIADTFLRTNSNISLAIDGHYFGYEWNDGSKDSFKQITQPGTYWVNYYNYCVFRSDTFRVANWPTSVPEINTGGMTMNVYPNPASGMVTITVDADLAIPCNMQLTDATGRMVLQQQVSDKTTKIDISGIASGCYNIQLISTNNAINAKANVIIIK